MGSVAQSREQHWKLTLDYVKNRELFGTTVAAMQNTKFELASVRFGDRSRPSHARPRPSAKLLEDELSGADAAKIKLFCTEMQGRVMDRCLQLHGGYGYILEYPIARLYTDARVSRIYGGTSEVMKTIVSKSLGL